MDPIALTMIEKYGGDFGRERLFSMFGMAIFSPLTGILIDYFSRGLGYTDYSSAFYIYDILLVISALTVFLMPLDEKPPADNVFRDLWNLVKLPHVMCFIFFLFVLGNFWGFIESFLFLYLKELGAPNYLLGFTLTVGTVSSIPFLYTGEFISWSLRWLRKNVAFSQQLKNHEHLRSRQPYCDCILRSRMSSRRLLFH